MIRTIGASIAVTVCFFYLGCGSIQVANASGGANTAPLTIATKLLPSAIAGTPYVVALDATGGTPGYTWSVTGGKLPSGVYLTPASGIISGTPTAGGSANFSVSVRDNEHPVQSQSLAMSLSVESTPLKIVTTALPSAVAGATYSQALRASGGTPGYKWTIASGSLPEGLTLAATGVVTGTPTSSGTATFTASVSDNSSPTQKVSAPITIGVATAHLTISTPSLPSGAVGTAYSQSFHVTGGVAPYAWSVASGRLPVGLTLTSATGAITGTPTVSGTSTFTATVTDSSKQVQSASVTTKVVVTSTQLTIKAIVLPAVKVGAAYLQALQASGGNTPYRWSIASGSLPAGLSLAPSTGTISGTPTSSGTATFTASVSDSSNPVQSAASTAAVVVTSNPLIITSSNLPTITVGAAYSQTLQATGGSAPYSWSISSGKLPVGLTLASSSGTISGTPTVSGPFTFSTTVTDSSSPSQSASTRIEVAVVPTTLAITTQSLASGTTGTGYSQTLQASGGSAPYTWSITAGQLGAGLSLSSSGVISGTATSSGSFNFTVTVADSNSPIGTNSAALNLKITGTSTPLSIVSTTMAPGTNGTAYSQVLQASGGTPAYTWSITSGGLPAGLTLASTSGTISGTPTSTGTSNFTATVTDNGSPVQQQSAASSITVAAASSPITGPGTTWYIRADGGTRYSANVTAGQCDGKADVAYPGTGTNQHCAFNDFRFMWDDQSYQNDAWVMAGGDTVIIRGCAASAAQQNPASPDCRIGWDANSGKGAGYTWCYGGNGPYTCTNPTIPAGTPTQPTRILGQNYASCSTGTATNRSALTQIFGGFGVLMALDLRGAKNVDVECLEITTHNGVCVLHGNPLYPRGCNTNSPLDDYDGTGIFTDNATSNVVLQDLYIHGHGNSGLFGPIGGQVTMTRMFVGFNGFAGWNFDDGHSTPDAPGSSIIANYVTMEGNGCNEQYPIVNAGFPALACYDDVSNGFGDSWSGQDTVLDSFTCNHCVQMYNTKDGFIGPHTQITNLLIENSASIGNMGQQWKWNNTPNATTVFINNLTVGNCLRMTQKLPGAPQSYAQSTGLPGAYLSDYCRAAGDIFSFSSQPNSSVLIANNTVVGYSSTVFDLNCGLAGGNPGNCSTTPFIFKNNIFLGYTNPTYSPSYVTAPGLYYYSAPTDVITSTNNVEYGIRNGDTCGGSNICLDPSMVSEPSSAWVDELELDNLNFTPSSKSPAVGTGITVSGVTTDYNGVTRPNPPSIGAIEP